MDTTPTGQSNAHPGSGRFIGSGRPQFGQGSASALSMKWSALHDAAETIALIAARPAPGMTPEIRNFPAVIRDAGGSRKARAEQGIEDISAIMEPGLSALLAAHARGVNPKAAAAALLEEFTGARDALLALVPPEKEGKPVRFA